MKFQDRKERVQPPYLIEISGVSVQIKRIMIDLANLNINLKHYKRCYSPDINISLRIEC